MLDMVVIPPLSPCRHKAQMTAQLGDREPWSLAFSILGERKKNHREKQPTLDCLANTDGKLAAVITDVVHGLR